MARSLFWLSDAKLVELGDRVLSDETLDPQRANAAAHAWAKAEAMMQPKTRVELSGANSGPVSVANDKPSMIVLARKVALAFRLVRGIGTHPQILYDRSTLGLEQLWVWHRNDANTLYYVLGSNIPLHVRIPSVLELDWTGVRYAYMIRTPPVGTETVWDEPLKCILAVTVQEHSVAAGGFFELLKNR